MSPLRLGVTVAIPMAVLSRMCRKSLYALCWPEVFKCLQKSSDKSCLGNCKRTDHIKKLDSSRQNRFYYDNCAKSFIDRIESV